MRPKASASFCLSVGSECHGMRKVRRSHQTNGDPALEISCEDQWKLGLLLEAVQEFRRLVGLASQKQWPIDVNSHRERAHVVLLHGIQEVQILGTLDVEKTGAAPDHEELSDLLLNRHLAQSFFRPFVGLAVLTDRKRLVLVLGKRGQGKGRQKQQKSKEFPHAGTIAEGEALNET